MVSLVPGATEWPAISKCGTGSALGTGVDFLRFRRIHARQRICTPAYEKGSCNKKGRDCSRPFLIIMK